MAAPTYEKGRHVDAFELFWLLGGERSHAEVARRIGVAPNTIGSWARVFDWQKRIQEREKLSHALAAQRAIEDEAQSINRQLSLCRNAMVRFAEALVNNRAQITAQDFVRLAQLEALLRSRATERSGTALEGPALAALIAHFSQMIEQEIPERCPSCAHELGIKSRIAEKLSSEALPPGGNA